MILIACNGLESISAAALMLRNYPDIEVHLSSAGMIDKSLRLIKRKKKAKEKNGIHILGLGIYCEPENVFPELNRLRRNGWEIKWYISGTYLEDYKSEIEKYAEYFADNEKCLPRIAAEENRLKDDDSDDLLKTMESGEGDKYDFIHDLVLMSIQRYFKYFDLDSVPGVIRKLANPELISPFDKAEVDRFRKVQSRYLLGKSKVMTDLKLKCKKIGEDPNCRVLITGETGTGKEVVAHLIFDCSPRRNNPFVPISCANLEQNLLESTLFGHEKGAFTGAHEMRRGVFEIANGGTLFLDEIGEMALSLQAKLLRVLQEGTFRRLGGSEDIKVDVRIISATNKDLRKAVVEKTFREDLYFRISEIILNTPPLREHPDDIKIIADDILYRLSIERSKDIPRLKRRQYDVLKKYSWPGNVRELENVLMRAIVLEEWDFEKLIFEYIDGQVFIEEDKVVPLNEHERDYILKVYNSLGKNKAKTAKVLGIAINTLKAKLGNI